MEADFYYAGSMRTLMLVSLAAVLSFSCGANPGGNDGGAGGGSGGSGGGSGGGAGGGGGSGGGTGGGSGGGAGGSGGGVGATTACPHVNLGRGTSFTYTGDTTGLPNWVTSTRLEWTDAPDDSLAFTADVAGNYKFTFTDSTTSNGGMGASIRNADNTFYMACPASGTQVATDGVFESPSYPVALTAGQQVLVYVSAAYWSTPAKAGAYTIKIEKQ
jgi:hypothetical protein